MAENNNNTAPPKENDCISLGENLELFKKSKLKDSAFEPIETGFSGVDRILKGGIYKGLTILGAESGLGKSTLVFQIAEQVAMNKKNKNLPILIFAMETTAFQINAKAICRGIFKSLMPSAHDNSFTEADAEALGLIEAIQLMNKDDLSRLDESTWERINAVRKNLQNAYKNIYVYKRLPGEKEADCDIIRKHIEEFTKAHPEMDTPLIIIDYLQILSGGSKEKLNDKQIIDNNVKTFSTMARDYPIILVSSMNRDSYKKKSKTMEDFKGSGEIEYTADALLSLEFVSSATDKVKLKTEFPRRVKLYLHKHRYAKPEVEVFFNYYAKYECFVQAGDLIETSLKDKTKNKKGKSVKNSKNETKKMYESKKKFFELPEVICK